MCRSGSRLEEWLDGTTFNHEGCFAFFFCADGVSESKGSDQTIDDYSGNQWKSCILFMLGSHFEEQLRNVERVQATSSAFAALLEDGSVVTWGDPGFGGDSSAVRDELKDVQEIQASERAFAAIREDRTVVAWGAQSYGGDCSGVRDRLRNVKEIQSNERAFAAIKLDGDIVTWGSEDFGGSLYLFGAA